MSCNLYEVMAENRANLEDEVFLRMSASSSLYNHPVDENILRGRVTRLVDAFLTSLQEGPEGFVTYIEDITEARIDEGVALHELQMALQEMEEKAWGCVVDFIPLADQVSCLSRITMTIGTAKDHIAHIYLHHLEMVEEAMSLMRSDTGAAVENDLNWQRGMVHPHHETA